MTTPIRKAGSLALLLLASSPLHALDFDVGEFGISFVNRFTIGAAWRIEERDPDLIGKLNLDPDLCAGDDCLSFTGDPEPIMRLVEAPGAFFGDKVDDGNLNYDQYDMVAGLAKVTSDLSINWRDFNLKARGIAFYDAVNTDFDEFHPNNDQVVADGVGGYQQRFTPRDDSTESVWGNDVRLQDLALSGFFFFGDRAVNLTLGAAKLRWGEANLIALNSLNEINPPDIRGLRQPGGQINEVFQPVPLVAISGDVFPDLGITAEAFYQLSWEPAIADPGGTFFGDVDALYRSGPASYAAINLGYFPEDPLEGPPQDPDSRGEHRLQNPLAALLTDTSFSGNVFQDGRYPDDRWRPRDEDQWGMRVNWFADMINNGTEFGFYYMQYHSRLPYLSFLAADKTPLRDGLTSTAADALLQCQLAGNDCLPVDTASAIVDYPEDITMYGLSFNTNVGSWSLAGEYSFRPDLPVQVSIPDVFFAALQPAFPDGDVVIGTQAVGDFLGNLGGGLNEFVLGPLDETLGAVIELLAEGGDGTPASDLGFPITVPGARNAAPDYLETIYRGTTVDENIATRGENYYIPGFVRQKVGQFSMTGIRILGNSHPLSALVGTEQIINLVEVGFTHIVDMVPADQVQFDGGSPNRTHYSPGADGTGQPDGEPDPRSLNPTQQREAFVDSFAWGYRLISFLEYNDVFWNLNFKPFVSFSHDVEGYAPYPMQNFIEDRMEWMLGSEVFYGQRWSAKLQYQGMTGNRHNSLRDRDNVLVELSYTF